MEKKNLSFNKNNLMNYIPIKTFKNYACSKNIKNLILCDFTKKNNKKNDYIKFPIKDKIEHVINKIKIENKIFLIVSKQKTTELYLMENDKLNLQKSNNSFLKNIIESSINRIIILDNDNIVVWNGKLSFYIKKNLSYEKFFNNLNKYGPILELCKLSDNRFCYLTSEMSTMFIILFNEDFSSKVKKLGISSAKKNINFTMFKICNDKIVIIGNSQFIIFDINFFEIILNFEVGFIYFATPFNEKGFIDNNDIYHNLAVIIKESDEFYIKIFNLSCHDIRETEKIKPKFQIISNEKNKFNYYLCDINDISTIFESTNNKSMYYDYNENGDLVLIINNNLSLITNIDLNKLKYI